MQVRSASVADDNTREENEYSDGMVHCRMIHRIDLQTYFRSNRLKFNYSTSKGRTDTCQMQRQKKMWESSHMGKRVSRALVSTETRKKRDAVKIMKGEFENVL